MYLRNGSRVFGIRLDNLSDDCVNPYRIFSCIANQRLRHFAISPINERVYRRHITTSSFG